MYDYHVIVNCVLWDTNRSDRLINKEDLKKFKKGTMIIDISCDPELEIETSIPTTIDDPVYTVHGVIHYAVDNTPAMFPITISKILSEKFSTMVDGLIKGNISDTLDKGLILNKEKILDDNIIKFRNQRGLL